MTISDIYNAINVSEALSNPFETEQSRNASEQFFDKYFGKGKGYDEREDDAFEDICGVIGHEREAAFCVGFKTAVSLLLSAT